MSHDPTLQVVVDNPIVETGSILRGQMTRAPELDDLAPEPTNRVREVRLRLHWFTEGRGDEDAGTVDERAYTVDQYGRTSGRFELHVPPVGPISYDGKLIRIIWQLEARTDIRLRTDRFVSIAILVIPRNGFGLYRVPHPLR